MSRLGKPYEIASTHVALIHPLVVKPVIIRVSIFKSFSFFERQVSKKALGYCFVITISFGLISNLDGQPAVSEPSIKQLKTGSFS